MSDKTIAFVGLGISIVTLIAVLRIGKGLQAADDKISGFASKLPPELAGLLGV